MLKLSFDGEIDIATGKSRKTKSWKNKKVLWSELVAKLSVTHRTAETHKDYLAERRDRQDEIKDIGGFVGGYLTGGKRGNGCVGHRQLITLDIDSGKPGVWDDFLMCYGCAAAMYTTHKHTPDRPRIRLVIPLDREIFADEYEPICRRIAGDIGIEAFTDVTTYEATRLMYWPSTSKDGEYLFDVQDGAWLSADEVLGRYVNWRDSSEWPVCSAEIEVVKHGIKKQEDPLEKTGLIGAFCRTYTVSEAIAKFLDSVYAPGTEGRYSYLEGSTANGLVIYQDDRFAFSHHGTDPCGGMLCNAFDLVRVHKYGIEDSTGKMLDFARQDKEVMLTYNLEQLERSREDFQLLAGLEPGEEVEEVEITDENMSWIKDLESNKKGEKISSIDNIYLILKNDPLLKGRLYFDEFENWMKIKGNLPWRVVRADSQDFTDDDCDCLAHYLEKYKMPFTHLQKALALIRNNNRIHPVRNYINGLRWDGAERLDTLFIDYLGADDNIYVRSATRKTFVAAIARVMEPGVQFDTVLTLIGEEGIGKSSIIRIMAGGGKWFSASLGDIHDKSGPESLRGVWIMEVPELSAFRRADEEAVKRFITIREDVYRPAYGKQQVRYPRQNIFIASSNKKDFLRGVHMHRRFLPIDTDMTIAIKDFYKQLSPAEVGQMWAEAYVYYQGGESLDLSREVKELAAKIREQHTEIDERAGLVRQFLSLKLPEDWEDKKLPERMRYVHFGIQSEFDEEIKEGEIDRLHVCIPELWCELMEKKRGDMTSQNTKYLHDIMSKMKGWKRGKLKRFGPLYGIQVSYDKV